MNLGITIFENRLLLASHSAAEKSPAFCQSYIDQPPRGKSYPGYLWNHIDVAAGDIYRTADRLILSVPGSICYLKKLEIDSKLLKDYPDYFDWVACIQLPGDLVQYKYEFIFSGQNFDGTTVEMIFSAMLIEPLNKFLYQLKRNNDPREIITIPEQLGLIKVLEKSLASDDIPQAAIVNCTNLGATMVLLKNNRLWQSKYFSIDQDHPENLAIDIETYLLSQSESSDPLPLVVTGIPDFLKSDTLSIQPSFLPVDALEFAAAWGVAEYVYSNGAK